jgi:hypothetical protein
LLTSVRFWVGAAITAVFLALLVLRFDFAEMRESLGSANYVYLIPAIGIYFISLYIRSFRWSYVLRPFASTRTSRLFPVVMVGYMANNVLPMRIGEFARSYYLSTREPVRGSTALATILIERVFDGLVLLFFLAIGTLFLPVTGLTDKVSKTVELPFGIEPPPLASSCVSWVDSKASTGPAASRRYSFSPSPYGWPKEPCTTSSPLVSAFKPSSTAWLS